MNPKRVWEVALTGLGAILLLIASAGRHSYGFYMVLRLVITVGAVYWRVAHPVLSVIGKVFKWVAHPAFFWRGGGFCSSYERSCLSAPRPSVI